MNARSRGLFAAFALLVPLLVEAGAADDVLATDAAFAARAVEVGQHLAFAEYLADDAVLFRPEAVGGQQWLATNEPATGRLEWSPSAAAAACTGRLAVTTGPWRYSNAAGGEPVAGHYLSVWRLDDAGQWLVLLDHGIDHPQDARPVQPLPQAFARLWLAGASGKCSGGGDARHLARAEDELNRRVARDGLADALQRVAANGALAYRDDVAPGPLANLTADPPFGRGAVAQTTGTIFAPDADMAATYGILRAADGSQRALYVRIWQRERRHWRVAIDLQTPLPAVSDP